MNTFSFAKKFRISGMLLASIGCLALSSAEAATINIGAVAQNDTTGFYLTSDGSYSTNGMIRVGAFSLSEDVLKSTIASWGSQAPTYSEYASLLPYFTEVGVATNTNSGSVVSGWNFHSLNGTNGTVAGTSSGVNLSYIGQNTQLYIWAFTMTNFTSSDFNTNSQWALVTSSNWLTPALGTKSLNLAQVSATDVLIGTDLSPVSNSVKMVAAIPEPSTVSLLGLAAGVLALGVLKRRKNSTEKTA